MSLRGIGEQQEARKHFVLAKDLDQLPLRCLTAWQDAGIRAAKEYAVPVVQSEEILRKLSPDGILDETLFLDGVHPNLKATFAIAQNVTRAIVTNEFAGTEITVDDMGNFSESLLELGVDANTLADAYSQTSDVWSHYAHFRAFARDNRERQARVWAQRAERLRNGEINPGEDGTEALEISP